MTEAPRYPGGMSGRGSDERVASLEEKNARLADALRVARGRIEDLNRQLTDRMLAAAASALLLFSAMAPAALAQTSTLIAVRQIASSRNMRGTSHSLRIANGPLKDSHPSHRSTHHGVPGRDVQLIR